MNHSEYFELCVKARKIVIDAYTEICPDWPSIGTEMFPNHKCDADKRFLNWKSNAKPFIPHHKHYPISISEEYVKEIYWSNEDSEVLGFLSRTIAYEYSVLPTNNLGECLECISYMFFKAKANKTYQLLAEAFKLCEFERGKITYDSFILTVRAVMRMDTIPNPEDSVRNRHAIIDNHMIDTFLHPIRKDRAKWFRSNEEFRAAFEYAKGHNFEPGCWKQAIISHVGQSYSMKKAFEEMLTLNRQEQDSLASTPWNVFHSYFRNNGDDTKAEELVRGYCKGNYDTPSFMIAIKKVLATKFDVQSHFGQYHKMISMSDDELMGLFNFRNVSLSATYELFGGETYYTEFKKQSPDHFNSRLGFLRHKVISTPQKLRKDLATFHNSLVSADKELIAPAITQQEFHNQKLNVLLSLSDDDLWYVIGRRTLHKLRAEYVWCDSFPSIAKWRAYMMERPHISGEDYCNAPAAFRNMVKDFFRYGGTSGHCEDKPIQTKRSSREEWITAKLAELKA